MNSGQTAAATLGGAILAENIIGGIGIGMLGTAFGIPAAAVVGAVGGAITVNKLIEENFPPESTADRANIYWLRKDSTIVRFRVHSVSEQGSYSMKDLTDENALFDKVHYHPVDKLRLYYKNFLDNGYRPVESCRGPYL